MKGPIRQLSIPVIEPCAIGGVQHLERRRTSNHQRRQLGTADDRAADIDLSQGRKPGILSVHDKAEMQSAIRDQR